MKGSPLATTNGWKRDIIARSRRQVWSVPVSQLPPLYQQADWVGLKTVVMVVRARHLYNKTTREIQFYLTSLDSDACKLGQAIRLHWSVENDLHWSLDVTFNEDARPCSYRTCTTKPCITATDCQGCFAGEASPQTLRLNALNREQSFKRSNRQKSNRAAMNNNYMLTILAACLSQHDNASLSACQ